MGVMLFIVLESDDVGTYQQSELGRQRGGRQAGSIKPRIHQLLKAA